MKRILLIGVAATTMATAHADIRILKPAEPPPFSHPGPKAVKPLLSRCPAILAASRTNPFLPRVWIAACADAAPPSDASPPEKQPRINGQSTTTGPGACSVVGEVGRSCRALKKSRAGAAEHSPVRPSP